MSRGLGKIQRHILEQLAANQADPMRDFEQQPCYQSWTAMHDLAGGKDARGWIDSSAVESYRRAVAKLADAGLVETRMMHGVEPHGWDIGDEDKREGFYAYRLYRHSGNQKLHVRLALSEEQKQAWDELFLSRWEDQAKPAEILYRPLPKFKKRKRGEGRAADTVGMTR